MKQAASSMQQEEQTAAGANAKGVGPKEGGERPRVERAAGGGGGVVSSGKGGGRGGHGDGNDNRTIRAGGRATETNKEGMPGKVTAEWGDTREEETRQAQLA